VSDAGDSEGIEELKLSGRESSGKAKSAGEEQRATHIAKEDLQEGEVESEF
jgi:hypothetical protein